MIINLYSNGKILTSENFDEASGEYYCMHSPYSGFVKESTIEHCVKSEKDLCLTELCEKLNAVNLAIVDAYEFKHDDGSSFKFIGQIKRIMCRTMSYLGNGVLTHKELLSIRVVDDEQPKLNKDKEYMCCGSNCHYLKDRRCSKYNWQLNAIDDNDYIVCESCYLNSSESLLREEIMKIYEHNRELYDSKSTIKNEETVR